MSQYNLSKSLDYINRISTVLPGGCHTNFCDSDKWFRLPLVKGEKSRVWDMDGNEHLDLFGSYGCMILGHSNTYYKDALKNSFNLFNGNSISGLEESVCNELVKNIPCAEMVRFGLSGTESVQNCIRLARAFTGKNKFLRFTGHYHGQADNILGGKYNNRDLPIPERYKGDIMETAGRAINIMEDQSLLIPWNDEELLIETLDKFSDELAAVIMEPINMNIAAIMPKDGYLQLVRKICTKKNIVLIFDEVLTTVRVGLGGAQKYLGVIPDLAIFGKAISGGSFPISAILGKKEIMNLYSKKKVVHGGTYNGYPLGLQAISTTMELLSHRGVYEHMNYILEKIGESFENAFYKEDLPLVIKKMPGAMSFHVRNNPLLSFEDYRTEQRTMDYIITKLASFNGIQFAPSSRLYGNIQMNENDVDFFDSKIKNILKLAKEDPVFKTMLRVCKY